MEPVLIATKADMTDVCAIKSFTLDMVIGHDEQDFTARFAPVENVGGGSLLYIDGTEYGGIVDDVTTSTESDVMECHGRTWDGILACKRIMPPAGSDYRTVSGEANGVLASLITLLDIGDVFAASTEDSGITVNYQFTRFVDGYEGIARMLDSAGAKLVMRRANGKTVMSAEAVQTISDEADSDLMDFAVTKTNRCVNHLVCAGEGEGAERVVLHLYSNANGAVSTTQTFTGRDEIAAFYDYNNADSTELLDEGTKKLKQYFTRGAVDISRIGRGDWGIGDVLVARDNQSGITVSTPIAGKTVQVDAGTNWQLHVEYVIGEVSRVKPSSSGTAEQSEKVNRDGDTMTGDLILDDAYAYCDSGNLDRDGASPNETVRGNSRIVFRDKDGERIGEVSCFKDASDNVGIRVGSITEMSDGTESGAWITIIAAKDGTHAYSVTSEAAFRAAIEAANRPDVLYNNSSGTNGTVSLSHSAASYNHMRIYYYAKSSNANDYKRYASTDVYSPDGNTAALFAAGPMNSTSTAVDISTKVVLISGSQITTERATAGNLKSSPSAGVYNEVYITRVEAWNE